MKAHIIGILIYIIAIGTMLTGCVQTTTAKGVETVEQIESQVNEVIQKTTEQSEQPQILFTDKEISEEPKIQEGPYLLKVNRTLGVVQVFCENDTKTPIKTMLCSVGIGGIKEEQVTPLGSFKIYERYEWRPLFGNVLGQYAIRFNEHILFHSVPYLEADKGTLKPEEYNKLGKPASMGCVRLCVADAKWIYDNCPDGTVVEVVDEDIDIKKPLGIKVAADSEYAGWDPTDPDENNPWKNKLPKIENVKNIIITAESDVSVLESVLDEVYGMDYDGTRLKVFIDNLPTIDLNTQGTYEIIYGTTGSYGATVYERAIVDVVSEVEYWNLKYYL